MNAHFSQSLAAESELRNLAAIPYQMISPGNNKPIIGIFQDSLLGSFRFTRPGITMTPREAMNLLMSYPHVDVDALRRAATGKNKQISNFDVLSQITPAITLKFRNSLYKDQEDPANSNNMIEIVAGKYVRGQLEKSALEAATKGILHRVCNDFGPVACADYNDALQNIVTEYMKTSSFSVGISDLIANQQTKTEIQNILTSHKQEAQTILDSLHLGTFQNTTARSNKEEFESRLNGILGRASEKSGSASRNNLDPNNRFVLIVTSGSKGSPINIAQMISCLGQQAVEGKRISYGFDHRTLPHYSKYDDSPTARGFIENSYITGLTAPELFFHAMAGRIGLIDTAVKSVTYDTKVIVLEHGKPLYTEIGAWIDRQLANHPTHIQKYDNNPEKKNMELLNLPEQSVYIPTVDDYGNVSWGELTAVTRHDPSDRLYKVTTRSGRTVTVAESESLLIWDSEKKAFLKKNSPEVVVGDCVPVTMRLNTPYPHHYTDRLLIDATQVSLELLIAPIEDVVEALTPYLKMNAVTTDDDADDIFLYNNSQEWLDTMNLLLARTGIYARYATTGTATSTNGLAFSYTSLVRETFGLTFGPKAVRAANLRRHQDVVSDPIVSIEVIGAEGHPKLYDVTVPSTLNFCLANGMGVRDTSSTGYIQRRLVKGMEDLQVRYDMTVRNNMGKIIQFAYGDDGFDSTKVENQVLPLVGMTVEDIYLHYDLPDPSKEATEALRVFTKPTLTRMRKQHAACQAKAHAYIEQMLKTRDDLVTQYYRYRNENGVRMPVAFQYIIANIHGQLGLGGTSAVDITPLEAFELVEDYHARLNRIPCVRTTPLFDIMYRYYLSPRELLVHKRFHRQGLVMLLETILLRFKEAVVHPGEMVGVVCAQSVGEPCTQLTLNTFHNIGNSSKTNVTRGVPRIEEILRLTKNPKNPSMTVFMKPAEEHDQSKAEKYLAQMTHTRLGDVVRSIRVCFDPHEETSEIEGDRRLMDQFFAFEQLMVECGAEVSPMDPKAERSRWILRLEFDAETLLEKQITMDDLHYAIVHSAYGADLECVFSDYNSDQLVCRIRTTSATFGKKKGAGAGGGARGKGKGKGGEEDEGAGTMQPSPLDQSDEIYLLKNFQDSLLQNIVLRGVAGVTNVQARTLQNTVVKDDGKYVKKESWVLDTTGSNLLDTLALDYVDATRTYSNDIKEVFDVLGIEAARQIIHHELLEVMEFSGVSINYHHTSLLADRMTCNQDMVSIFRSGLLSDNVGPIAKATFEMHTEVFLDAARHGEFDPMTGVSAAIMCGQQGGYGTSSFQVIMDTQALAGVESVERATRAGPSVEETMQQRAAAQGGDACTLAALEIDNHIHTIRAAPAADVCTTDDYDAGF